MAAFLDASSALFQTCAFRSCLPEFNSLPRTGTVRPDGMTFGPSVRGAYLISESQNLRISESCGAVLVFRNQPWCLSTMQPNTKSTASRIAIMELLSTDISITHLQLIPHID